MRLFLPQRKKRRRGRGNRESSPIKNRKLLTSVSGFDTSSLQIVNRPPTRSKPIYMKVWEARKADGLEYDPEDERQQAFLSEITKYNIRSIE